jgi:hypothetical protein
VAGQLPHAVKPHHRGLIAGMPERL